MAGAFAVPCLVPVAVQVPSENIPSSFDATGLEVKGRSEEQQQDKASVARGKYLGFLWAIALFH